MTDAQRAALSPTDTVLVRATVEPRDPTGWLMPFDHGTHVRVRVGHQVFYAPAECVMDVMPQRAAA